MNYILTVLTIVACLCIGTTVQAEMSQQATNPAPVFPQDQSSVVWSDSSDWIDDWSCAGVMRDSIFCKTDPNSWRPLPLSTLFSDGWHDSWVPSPNGSGGAPRQGWINAIDGNMYRLSFFSFAQGFNSSPMSNSYRGAYTLLTPFNRRLMLITNVPFVLTNNAPTGLPTIDTEGNAHPTTSHTTFGDVSFTPRVLLHETKDFSVTADLTVSTPTGNPPLGGTTALVPTIGFWHNIAGGWVVRGGVGIDLPINGSASDVLINQLAIGQTVTGHDVPLFGDFTWYVSGVSNTPVNGSGATSVSVTPGIRTHLGNDWYFLGAVPTPLTEQRVANLGMIFWFMKAW